MPLEPLNEDHCSYVPEEADVQNALNRGSLREKVCDNMPGRKTCSCHTSDRLHSHRQRPYQIDNADPAINEETPEDENVSGQVRKPQRISDRSTLAATEQILPSQAPEIDAPDSYNADLHTHLHPEHQPAFSPLDDIQVPQSTLPLAS